MKLSERVNLDEVLKHSFRDFHVKGLDYICLRRSFIETWKLYFFDGDASKAPEVIYPHDHRYCFDTRVMSGVVENVLYGHTAKPEAPRYNRFEWLTPLNPGPSGFTFIEECGLEELGRLRYSKGNVELYGMNHKQIHTLRIAATNTVLFLKQYEDVVPIGVPTSTYCRGDAPSIGGLYTRFDMDTLVSKLKAFEENTGIRVETLDERLDFTT
jgi:hypothetical protein